MRKTRYPQEFIRYTSEELAQARETDMIEFLERQNGFSFIKEGSDYRCREHNSLCIRRDRKRWYWNSRGIGGNNAIDWLRSIENLDFQTACKVLISKASFEKNNFISAPKLPEEKAPFKLPEAYKGKYVQAYSYLAYTRNISHNIIKYCFDNKILYQDVYRNCVFVGYDENNIAKFAERKSTSLYPFAIGKVDLFYSDSITHSDFKTLSEKSQSEFSVCDDRSVSFICDKPSQDLFKKNFRGHKFRGNIASADFSYGFHIDAREPTDRVFIFEAPIDLLAHATLNNMKSYAAGNKDWQNAFLKHNRLSLSGTTDYSVGPYLQRHPEIKSIIVCTDNDSAGRKAAEKIRSKYSSKGYSVTYIPAKRGKDYSEYLDITVQSQNNNAQQSANYRR